LGTKQTTTRPTIPGVIASPCATPAIDDQADSSGSSFFGHRHAEVAKRIDIAAVALFHEMTIDAISDLDLSYTPPLGSPWDAVQAGAQTWTRETAR
jgi:hypothetical protein